MKKIVQYIGRTIIAFVLGYLTLGIIIFIIDKVSNQLNRHSKFKDILESLLLWISPLGFGIVIFIILSIIYFKLIPKWIDAFKVEN